MYYKVWLLFALNILLFFRMQRKFRIAYIVKYLHHDSISRYFILMCIQMTFVKIYLFYCYYCYFLQYLPTGIAPLSCARRSACAGNWPERSTSSLLPHVCVLAASHKASHGLLSSKWLLLMVRLCGLLYLVCGPDWTQQTSLCSK